MTQAIIFIVGLTAVGKSSTVAQLKTSHKLLPNRRELTDRIIIPEVQRSLNQALVPISDRIERFEMTGRYRQMQPEGMIHALKTYLLEHPITEAALFDNIRGIDECRAAVGTFSQSRFIVLDAPVMLRLKRLVGRTDSFDQVAATRLENSSFIDRLLSIEGLGQQFDAYELARFEANAGVSEKRILDTVKIILSESTNYDSSAAITYLQSVLSPERLLVIDTSQHDITGVTDIIERWL